MNNEYKPFIGLFGNCDESNLLEHVLALENVEFTTADVSNDIGITKVKAQKIINRFVLYQILKQIKIKNETYYTPKSGSKIFKTLKNVQHEILEIYTRDDME